MSQEEVVVQAFTELAPAYEETVDRELRRCWGVGYREFIGRLIEGVVIEEGDAVLDVATGTALIPLELVDRLGPRGWVLGLDITPDMLERGQAKIEATKSSSCISLVCASGMDMPFAEGVFDVVICALGTHHMDVPKMLSEMGRVLKEGGRLILADVGASAFWRSFWGLALLRILMFHYGLAHNSARARAEIEAFPNVCTADEWRAMLSEFGFTEIKVVALRARRPWYPCALTMRAVLGKA